MTKVYLSGEYDSRYFLRGERAKLLKAGYTVTSTWLDCETPNLERPDMRLKPQAGAMIALANYADIRISDVFIQYTSERYSPGTYVEFGYAYATARSIVIVGERRSVFHCTDRVRVVTNLNEWLASGVRR